MTDIQEGGGITMGELVGRRVLVVGASAGIGQGIGMALSAEGARVTLAARRLERLEEAAAACPTETAIARCDVRNPDDCRSVVEAAVAAFGGLDAVVYAAGTTAFVEASKATSEDWHLTLETNLIGAALVTSAALPHLIESQGHAVYLSSNSARFYSPWRGLATYTASKRGLEALVQTLRLENPSVAFTTLVVGPTLSEFGAEGGDALLHFSTDWHARGQLASAQMLEAEDHARAVISILSADARVCVSEIVLEPR